MEALPFSAQTSAKSRVNPALNADLEPTGRPFGFPDCPGCQGFKLVWVFIVTHCCSAKSCGLVEDASRSVKDCRAGTARLSPEHHSVTAARTWRRTQPVAFRPCRA